MKKVIITGVQGDSPCKPVWHDICLHGNDSTTTIAEILMPTTHPGSIVLRKLALY